ncbi:MAG: rRNA methyltransferase [Spirochaetaceae bacterium]|jgi:hypothetical protein|nr:rRNA methyltransferase [Spirochaetaceae bacterium]
MNKTPRPDADIPAELEALMVLIEQSFPLEKRFRHTLPRDVARLSRLLTFERAEREAGYMGQAALLSAYLRYFLPWNVYRLSRILPELPLSLKDGDSLLDLGSGPLTFPIALWLCRRELRSLTLEFRCLDHNGRALEAGLVLFRALAGKDAPWSIKTMRSSLGEKIPGKKAALVSAIEFYNELFQHERRSIGEFADKQGGLLSALADSDGSILVAEPGIPQSGAFISALRAALIRRGRLPCAPCVHAEACAFPGPTAGRRREKWCHFAFAVEDAPRQLLDLSLAAGLPKDRAVLSFLYAGASSAANASYTSVDRPDTGANASRANTSHLNTDAKASPAGNTKRPDTSCPVRVISDSFSLENGRWGRYGCSGQGMVLLSASRRSMDATPSGSLVMALKTPARDKKSGALIMEMPENLAAPRGVKPFAADKNTRLS